MDIGLLFIGVVVCLLVYLFYLLIFGCRSNTNKINKEQLVPISKPNKHRELRSLTHTKLTSDFKDSIYQ